MEKESSIMNDSVLLIDKQEGIVTVTLNRPKAMNALSTELMSAIKLGFEEIIQDEQARVIIFTGAGKAFCCGLDLKELASITSSIEDSEMGNAVKGLLEALENIDIPIIGAINGYATTGGFELALACDILIASPEAFFADTHARVGIIPAGGLSQKLSRIIGIGRAKELSLTGNFLDAEKAERWGLVNRVVPQDELLPVCRELAENIASCDKKIISIYKKLIDQGYSSTLSEGMELELKVHHEFHHGYANRFDESHRKEVQQKGRDR
jgi:enoyl-CoA hydratase